MWPDQVLGKSGQDRVSDGNPDDLSSSPLKHGRENSPPEVHRSPISARDSRNDSLEKLGVGLSTRVSDRA